jgi:hypothetical protein
VTGFNQGNDKTLIDSQTVVLSPKKVDKGELSEKIYYECFFCGKRSGLYTAERRLCEKLSGDKFYCSFCLRHNLHQKSNRNVLVLSLRSIFAYYYYEKYLYTANRELWISEIMDYIDAHESVGLKNPVFVYDTDSFLWFIDFSKVGKSGKKIRVNEVLKTIINMLVCLNLEHHIPSVKTGKLYHKIYDAIMKFYRNRYRPEDKRMLIPTLKDCGAWESKKFSFDWSRDFLPDKIYG